MLHPAIARKVLARFAAPAGQTKAAPAGHNGEHSLTDREQEVLQLAACGLSNAEISARLYLSVRTVQVPSRISSTSSASVPAPKP